MIFFLFIHQMASLTHVQSHTIVMYAIGLYMIAQPSLVCDSHSGHRYRC